MSTPAQAAVNDDWIVVENQDVGGTAPGTLTAYDPSATDLTQSSAQKWTWTPIAGSTSTTFPQTQVDHYKLPTDFRLRNTSQGQRVVVTSSDGLAAIIDPSTKGRVWSVDLNGNDLHASELLPNGNMVVGSTSTNPGLTDSGKGGFIRVYASSQSGTAGYVYAEYPLNDVHEVLWDPTFDRLWAIGEIAGTTTYVLDSFTITGSDAQPHLTLATQTTLSGSHDLNADPHNSNVLLLASGTDLDSYDKATGQLTLVDGLPGAVKSFTKEPSGELVVTQPDAACQQAHPNDTWCTDTVDLLTENSSGVWTDSPRLVSGKQFYRARVWNPSYNAVGDRAHGSVTDHMLAAGAWTTSVEDGNTAISQISAAALPDGTMHVETLVPGYGVYDHTLNADGTWQSSTTSIDPNPAITAISSAVVGKTLHVQTVVPGYGVYDRALVGGAWAANATVVDPNTHITQTAAAAVGNTLHLETLVPGYGVYDNALAPGTNETWGTSATALPAIAGVCTTDATTACTAQISAVGRADGTLHVQELAPGAGMYDLTLSGGAWLQPTLVDGNASITRIAASTLSTSGPGGQSLDLSGDTHLETLVPGYGVYDHTLAPGTSATWAGSATKIDTATNDFAVYSAGTTGSVLHVGTAAYPLTMP